MTPPYSFFRVCRVVLRAAGLLGILTLCAPGVSAQSPAAAACPPDSFLSGNLAVNPDLETTGPNGAFTCWVNGLPTPPPSAAADWFMHTSNGLAPVCSFQAPGSAPGPGGARVLGFLAGGNEGGIFQQFTVPPNQTYMFSVWVLVRSGHVAIQSNALTGGPVAWSTKVGEWEQLRVCTNALFSTNMLVVYNQDPAGGIFFVDRVEVRQIAVQ